MSLGIIIVNYNSGQYLRRVLGKFKKEGLEKGIEVAIIDNGEFTGEGRRRKLGKVLGELARGLGCKLLENKENAGFSRACNQGARKVGKKYLLFLNPDCLISLKGVKKMVSLIEKDREIGIVAPRLLDEDKKEQRWSYGGGRLIRKGRMEVDWVSGACFLVRRKDFFKLKGFDPRFFMYFEDRDLCLRMRKAGFKIVRCLRTRAIHSISRSRVDWRKRKKTYYKAQNYFYLKHYGWFWALMMKIARIPVYFKNVYFIGYILFFTSFFAGTEC